AVLPALFERLYPAMDATGRVYEIVFVDDGSCDRSPGLLRAQYQARPQVTQVICLKANAGQHAALLAGFKYARGRRMVTLDADLQNPPEEIGHLLDVMDTGHDYVGSIRRMRQDSLWRRFASRMMNRLRERLTRIRMTDQGCMLRAYDRDIVDAILDSREVTTFIPALAYLYAARPTEVEVGHEQRAAGSSKYSLFQLIRLNFDLFTSFSLAPLQAFSMLGMFTSTLSILFVIYLAVRRLLVGPEAQGVFTLFGIAFFLIGIALFGIGLLGEYLGRMYLQVRQRPRYLVGSVLACSDDKVSQQAHDPRRTGKDRP